MHNRNAIAFITAVCAFIGFFACTTASAQQSDDKCRDVLRNGVFATMEYEEKGHFQQVVWSRFLSSNYESSKTDKSLGFGVPAGEIVFGNLNYTDAQFRAKQKQIQDENFQRIETNNEIDTFHSFGDPTIIKEWGNCMRERGGLSLTFKKNSPTEITASLVWHPIAGVPSVRLTENINLPNGARFTNGSRPACFGRGRTLNPGVPCVIPITLSNALQTLQWGITTANGSASAYLPPRIELRQERKSFDVTRFNDYRLRREKKRDTESPTITLTLTDEELNNGWTFDSNSARVDLIDIRTLDNNYCRVTGFGADAYTFTYGLEVAGRTWGKGKNSTAVCEVHPSIMIVRNIWIAQATTVNL